MLKLYSAEICPFAQRARAVLTRLELPFELITVDLSNRDAEFLKLSPTGKVPLLLDGELKLYESQIIVEYLAEKHGWDGAFSEDVGLRARQRVAMKQWDAAVITVWYRSVRDPGILDEKTRGRLEKELDELTETVALMDGEVENLPAIHCAPFWARMDWLREHSAATALFDERRALKEWLDRAVALPEIQETLPEREWTVRQYLEHYVKPVRG